jgi:hypothetical protein
MDDEGPGRRYAILIGVNAYPKDPLKGAVRDIEEIRRLFQDEVHTVEVDWFTATQNDNASTGSLAEHPDHWPTYRNVVPTLESLIGLAKAGDFVYIHYSGHGTTTPPHHSSPAGSTSDLALVLLETNSDTMDMRYLRGSELALLLQRLVKKSVIVTLVLDCCFSGSVVRKDALVRHVTYDPVIDATYPLDTERTPTWFQGEDVPTYRRASLRPNWLVNPNGYTILTACGPTETAKELVLQNGQRHGALSHFLVRTFKRIGGVGGKQQQIYHHLCTRFRQNQARQNPMFYGNQELCFFGQSASETQTARIPVIRKSDGSFQLQAGQAQGVCVEDKYAMSPIDLVSKKTVTDMHTIVGTIGRVDALTSDLLIPERQQHLVEAHWMAVPMTWLTLRRFPVYLKFGSQSSGTWTTILQEQPSLDVFAENNEHPRPASFYIVSYGENGYAILDALYHQVVELPTMCDHATNSIRHIVDAMLHIAKFHMVRHLTNASPSNLSYEFRESFTALLVDHAGQEFSPGCRQEGWLYPGCSHTECAVSVANGAKLELLIRNKSSQLLYVHVYNMSQTWEIENILYANHEVVLPAGRWRKKMKMVVPPEARVQGLTSQEDIVKVFVTSRPTSFASLELPELMTAPHKSEISQLRRPDGGPSSDNWMAFNFRIRTEIDVSKPTTAEMIDSRISD